MTAIQADHAAQPRAAPIGTRAPALAPTLLGQAPSLVQESKGNVGTPSKSFRFLPSSEGFSAVRSLPASYPASLSGRFSSPPTTILPPTSMQAGPPTSPSKVTDVVTVGAHIFETSKVLGRGAFGVVWEASSNDFSGDIALKVTKPKREEALQFAVLECEVLEELTQALAHDAPASAWRVPKYLAHSSGTSVGTEVKLAMSKVEGRPLDLWLYGVHENQLCDISMEKLLDGPLPAGRRGSQSLEGSASVASSLLSQMAPVFNSLQGIAYHRDLSAHNVLIGGVMGDLDFKLIDFGLAARSDEWRENWRSSSLTGDPRYWSPAAWMIFAHGPQYLEEHSSGICHQYKDRIDHYAFGVLTLEVLFALWHGPSQETGEVDAMAVAQAAWRTYWRTAYGLFQRFHSSDGYLKLREELVRSEEISEMMTQHAALCSALRAAAKTALEADGVPSVGLLAAAPVLLAAVELIDMQGSMPWSLVQEQLDIVPPPPPPLFRNVGHRRVLSESQAARGEDWSADSFHKTQSMPAKFSHRKMLSEPVVTSPAFMGSTRSMRPSMALRMPSGLLTDR